MLSIFFVAQTHDGVRVWKKKELIYSEKPEVVLGYRSFMGGADKVHQFCACFSFTTKLHK
jgi:hypothetical protein